MTAKRKVRKLFFNFVLFIFLFFKMSTLRIYGENILKTYNGMMEKNL